MTLTSLTYLDTDAPNSFPRGSPSPVYPLKTPLSARKDIFVANPKDTVSARVHRVVLRSAEIDHQCPFTPAYIQGYPNLRKLLGGCTSRIQPALPCVGQNSLDSSLYQLPTRIHVPEFFGCIPFASVPVLCVHIVCQLFHAPLLAIGRSHGRHDTNGD